MGARWGRLRKVGGSSGSFAAASAASDGEIQAKAAHGTAATAACGSGDCGAANGLGPTTPPMSVTGGSTHFAMVTFSTACTDGGDGGRGGGSNDGPSGAHGASPALSRFRQVAEALRPQGDPTAGTAVRDGSEPRSAEAAARAALPAGGDGGGLGARVMPVERPPQG